jgi:hypothetical protein
VKTGKDKTCQMGNFIAAVIFYQIIPLIPLWFEWKHTSDIKMDSFTLTVSIYSFAIGFSSKYIGQLAVCFFIGLLQAGAYIGNSTQSAIPFYNSLTFYCLIVVFGTHLGERYKRHFLEEESFFSINFTK